MIEALEPAGVGALMALMEERKKKLAAEGLFDEARKQLLPWLPEVIGVVTSPTGAVIRDILHRLEDRFPRRVLVWPVKVQGEGAAEQIAAAIRGFNALPETGRIPRPDLLIVARGGGSLEDLWSFNEEIVVRAAADSMIPLISAVGHETDMTLIDFAADKRAPTPTAAAEMAVPVRSELFVEVSALARRTMVCWQRGQESRRNELRAAARALPSAGNLLAIPRQRLDSAARRPAPWTEGQHQRAPSALHAYQRGAHPAGAARPGRASPPAPDRIGRADRAFGALIVAKPQGSLCGAGSAFQSLKACQRAGAAQRHRPQPRTHATAGRTRATCAHDADAAARRASCSQRTVVVGIVLSRRAGARLCARPRRARARGACRGIRRTQRASVDRIRRRPRGGDRGRGSAAGNFDAGRRTEDRSPRAEAGRAQARCKTGRSGKLVLKLAKPQVDIGLSTNNLDPMLAFWQGAVGLKLDHVLPVRRGQKQHRHSAAGSVVKINHHVDPLPDAPPSGYRELIIAQPTRAAPLTLSDPDGNRVCLVPPGHDGVHQIGIRLAVRDIDAHRRFYAGALGLTEEASASGAAFRAGETLITLEQDRGVSIDPGIRGRGWRYITFQIFKVDDVHAEVLAAGGREALAPVTLGTTARISMVLDPDGNWIELSQRASIVGALT